MPPRLAVAIVTHDAKDSVLRLLDSLAADPDRAEWEVIVVDNESRDRTAEALHERQAWVRVIRNERGRGFAGGLNQAAAATSAPAIVTLTPHTLVPRGTFGRLLTALELRPSLAAVGPLVRSPDGTVQRHGMYRPRPYTAMVVLLGLARLPFFGREAARYYGSHATGPPVAVDQLTGGCLMLRRVAFESVGPFDERFFVYCEDVDWCLRARDAGWELLFVPEVAVVREKAATSRADSAWAIRTYYRSLRRFYAKHHATRDPLPVRGLWYAGAYAKEALALLAAAVRPRKGLRY